MRLVDRLVEAGLVERLPGHDGRSLSIVLTASGRALSRKVTAARARAIEESLDVLDADDRRALVVLIDSLVGAVTVHRLDGREHDVAYAGWLCRFCDFASCGRPLGQCPAANAAQSEASGHRQERRQ